MGDISTFLFIFAVSALASEASPREALRLDDDIEDYAHKFFFKGESCDSILMTEPWVIQREHKR